jgi:hypothetical protein
MLAQVVIEEIVTGAVAGRYSVQITKKISVMINSIYGGVRPRIRRTICANGLAIGPSVKK